MTPQEILAQYGPRESMEYDVVVVGGGPAGMATAIRIKQLAAAKGQEVSVVVLEKGAEPGAHTLSGAVVDPIALNELFPDWKERGAPLNQAVIDDKVLFLAEDGGTATTPAWIVPECFHNHGNYVVALGSLVKWMGEQAEALGVEVFPGFTAALLLFYIYQVGFSFWDTTYAAALTVVLLAILGLLALIQYGVLERRVHYR